MDDLARGVQSLSEARTRMVRESELRRARERLRNAEQRYAALRNRTPAYYRPTHPHLNRQARKQVLKGERGLWHREVDAGRRQVAIATDNAKQAKPLTRTGERARALWNSPVRTGASRVLLPVGVAVSGVDTMNNLRDGNYLDAGVSATMALASASLVAFPVLGATVLVAGTLYQNREAIVNGAKWAKDTVVGGFKKLFGRS